VPYYEFFVNKFVGAMPYVYTVCINCPMT